MKILEVAASLDGGGVDRLLYDYCTRMIGSNLQFDFLISNSGTIGILEKPLTDLGCNIYKFTPRRKNMLLYIRQVENVIKNGDYNIIHCHAEYRDFFALYYARKYGIPVRIAHSHIAYQPEAHKEQYSRLLLGSLTKYVATDLFACGNDAAHWMWHKDCYIMRNAINTQNFAFSQTRRDILRKELGINEKFVVGNVGRLSYQKNHEFLLKVFSEVKKLRSDAVLLLVGRGELEEEIKQQVADLGLERDVVFLGVRNDVPDLLNAIDVFCLPSRYEGLPVVMVEAQANGLPIVASDSITQEIKLADNVHYMPLSKSSSVWAKKIVDCDGCRNADGVEIIKQNGYDIDVEAKKIQKKYLDLYAKVIQERHEVK